MVTTDTVLALLLISLRLRSRTWLATRLPVWALTLGMVWSKPPQGPTIKFRYQLRCINAGLTVLVLCRGGEPTNAA